MFSSQVGNEIVEGIYYFGGGELGSLFSYFYYFKCISVSLYQS
jgi:hypothetical protein